MSVPGFDPLTGTLALPLWAVGALIALFLAFVGMAFIRAGGAGLSGGLGRVALVLFGAVVTWFFVDGTARQDHAAERRALEARAATLATRATMPGSPLACLDAMAGDTVEGACERTLFATPEALAAAVSYVAAQWNLFADASVFVRRSNDRGGEPLLAGLRRALESDRYGLVAHVLATRDGCTEGRCPALALLRDAQRVNTNLTERTYDSHVARHASAWPAPATQAAPAAVSAAPPAALPPGAAAFAAPRPPGPDVFFPSSDSIPPVNIMTAEPPTREPETTGGGTTRPQANPRRPAQPAPKQATPAPIDLNAATRGAPAAAQ